MEKSEFFVLIKHCFLMGKILFKQSNGFISVIQTLLHLKQWLRGDMLTLNAVVQTQMMLNAQVAQIWQFHKLILADHKLKLRKIAEELKISEGSLITILHECLSMRKLCSKWVLCLLIVNQNCVDDSEHYLQLFQHNKEKLLCKYVTMDETWIHHFTPESAEWTPADESHPKRPKTQTLAGKVLASIFWDAQGILFIDYFEKGKTINSEYYIISLMCLKEEFSEKTATNEEEKSVLSPRQCTCHKSIAIMAKLPELHFKLLPHEPYSPDLTPND